MNSTEVTLGIDIGGTNTLFGLVDQEGNCHLRGKIPTEADKPADEMFKRLFVKFRDTTSEFSQSFTIKGVGVGAPNANHYTGKIENPPNLSWKSIDLVELINNHINLPVAVTNDANAAALGELMFGNAKDMQNFIEITLGTGLGSGIVVNGELVYGHDGFAGEMGHVIIERNGRLCGCGRHGCLEAYVSATGITRTVKELLSSSDKPSLLRNIPIDRLDSKKIYDAALANDELAREAFETTGRLLGETLANAVAYFSPEAIFLFGGLAAAGDYIFKPVKEHMEANLLHIFKNKVKILPSGLPMGEAAILGAGALIWHQLSA
ncbi:MAG: ROK family protein [Candidatus Marinimicrobia bacterium]|nr:ROK family protein [Candidatus Neomarinimicrobiota bacterium]